MNTNIITQVSNHLQECLYKRYKLFETSPCIIFLIQFFHQVLHPRSISFFFNYTVPPWKASTVQYSIIIKKEKLITANLSLELYTNSRYPWRWNCLIEHVQKIKKKKFKNRFYTIENVLFIWNISSYQFFCGTFLYTKNLRMCDINK